MMFFITALYIFVLILWDTKEKILESKLITKLILGFHCTRHYLTLVLSAVYMLTSCTVVRVCDA
jgi:hypothetical protein